MEQYIRKYEFFGHSYVVHWRKLWDIGCLYKRGNHLTDNNTFTDIAI